ncbi:MULTISPECIES: NAD(P)/FAD-dependent oxidoreductase [unclassified Streptomyces]|uniref:NAD(P)/FAD-dependent oxidoreductase n=1 Tax=unclassified Streptomyces TaxID=2593676 RepID=UPI002258BFC3|nr:MULTISPECIES: NAD(P)/FAD-dependent oxidoreductase [unclassified Streptomyces]MCX4884625.1 NAD(P)/FAD-dependent oxidoreductase [Streptomyces sp. NBC_00847]MCX5424771.1 NAD(P)/FAD-dependent oxidoreductase [Streptomyces sp. NBC_00078]
MTEQKTSDDAVSEFDVAIMGGGAAGLTLAMHLHRARPGTSIVVVEKSTRAPEAAHKVGESTVDIAAHYMRDVLKVEPHITGRQLDKFGLRFFFTQADNRDIARRVELGHAHRPHVGATYQIDRGRFENYLSDELTDLGVDVWVGHRIDKIDLTDTGRRHSVSVTTPDGEHRGIRARWVLDASGRASLLKRKLGLAKPNGHNVNAAWFRIDHPIDIDEWSSLSSWHERITDGHRRLSTNHLMGEGYWVWLIPLASNSISVGIVADAEIHPFDKINRFEKALTWLREHEPQCAEVVESHRDKLLDFKVMRNYSYGCEQVYSEQGWCLTGEAGIFLDPLYSPGFDVISLSNGLITDLVTRALDGEDISELAAIHNNVFFLVTDGWLPIYEGQYPIMGNARVMSAKIIWDTGVYWAVASLLYHHDQFRQLGDRPRLVAQMARISTITEPVQRFFRQWYDVEPKAHADGFVTYYDFDFMTRFHEGMVGDLPDAELDDQFAANLDELERIAGELVSAVIAECDAADDEVRRDQADRWRADKALMRLVDSYQSHGTSEEAWITVGPDGLAKGGGRDFSIRPHGSDAAAPTKGTEGDIEAGALAGGQSR